MGDRVVLRALGGDLERDGAVPRQLWVENSRNEKVKKSPEQVRNDIDEWSRLVECGDLATGADVDRLYAGFAHALTGLLRYERLYIARLDEYGQVSSAPSFGADGTPGVSRTLVLNRAFQYAATFGYTVWLRPQDAWLGKGVAASGSVATRLGLSGVPVSAETIAFCQAMGLNPQTMLKHIGHSPYIGTGLMRIRVPMMIQEKFTPATMKIGVWQKDMSIIGQMMRSHALHAPLFQASASIYDQAESKGLGEYDTAAVAQILAPARRTHRS